MKKYAYINGILLDGTKDMEPKTGLTILTEGEKITAVDSSPEVPAGYEVIDLKGAYIMPGLINLHIHLPATGKPKKKESNPVKTVKLMTSCALLKAVLKAMCASSAKTQLMSGCTTVRTVGGVLNTDSIIRDEINAGKRVGPRILAANMAVSVPGGHMAGSLGYEARSIEEAVAFVDKIAKDKPDLIKLMITGGVLDAIKVGEPGALKMPPEMVKAACDRAHELGFKVAAHVESPEGVRVALENGVDSIEHGARPDEDIINMFKEKGTALVATLSPALPYALFDREITHFSEVGQINGRVVFEGIKDCARACLDNGVTVGLGTDTGCTYITHYDMWRELNYYCKYCGVSPAFALHTATLINASIAGIAKETGSIEPGKCADFIVTEANPLEDIKVLRNISMVVTRGSVIKAPKVKKMPEVEVELDKFL